MNLKPKKYSEIDFDSIEASENAVEIMRNKKCLRDIYIEKYNLMSKLRRKLLANDGKVLEIGSGGGFIKDLFPDIITSDVKQLNNVDLVLNAEEMPFEDHSLDAIFAVHVLHHIPDVTKFFDEADRVLKKGGGIVCIEPYWSPFGVFVYKNFHPEPFDKKAQKWQLDCSNPMTGSNQAMSYIVLKRDKKTFENMYPQFKLVYLKRFGFIRYIMTGGIWLDKKLPNWMFPVLKYFEIVLRPFMPLIAIHHAFVIKKID